MWKITSENRVTEEGVEYTAYGISAVGFMLSDVCVNKREAEELVGLLNRYDASVINAADIIEDYIAVH